MKKLIAALAVSAFAVTAAQAAELAEIDSDANGMISMEEAKAAKVFAETALDSMRVYSHWISTFMLSRMGCYQEVERRGVEGLRLAESVGPPPYYAICLELLSAISAKPGFISVCS